MLGPIKLRKENPNNPNIAYSNINSYREKNISLQEICLKSSIDILCVDETKLDVSYPNAQFHIEGCQYPTFRRDRNKYVGGKMVFARNSIIAKRLESLEEEESETICTEVTISKKKWCMTYAYRPLHNDKKVMFFNKLNLPLNSCINEYHNIIGMGGLNIDISNKRKDNNNFLLDLCDTFSLQNIIPGKTCHKSNAGTSVDIMLTNRPRSFHKTSIFETGISNHHKLIFSFFRSYFTRLPPKPIKYRKYKTFDKSKFLHDFDQELLKGAIYQNNEEMYSNFTRIFPNVLNKHAPLKQKKVQENHAPLMTKDLSKAIMNKSKTRNRYLKWPSRENVLAMKSAKNL